MDGGHDAQLIAALRAATDDDRARLRAAIEAVRAASPPLFEWRGGQKDASGAIQMSYPEYHPAVDELRNALGHARAIPVFDWMNWDGARRYPRADDVLAAPLADVARLITTFIRGERFADGTIAAALDDGRLLAAAERILDAG